MKNNAQIDLGHGDIRRTLFRLSVPTIIAQMVNILYNLVDRIFIGHIPLVGDDALSGLGICFPIITAVSAFSLLFGQGGAPRAAIAMGQGDNSRGEKILGACTATLLTASVILTVLLELMAEPVLRAFGASDVTLPYAVSYLRVYLLGTVFVMISSGLNLFMITQGFTRTGMMTNVIGAVLNVLLDPLFIYSFRMGVIGAAAATVISQCVSAIWVIVFLSGKRTRLRIRRRNLRIDAGIMLPVLALGVSPFVMQITESLLNVAFNTSLARYGGDVAVASMTIMHSALQLQSQPMFGLMMGAQPLISFNYGAGESVRVKQTFRLAYVLCVAYSFIIWCVIMFAPEWFITVFNSESPELLETASWMMRVYMSACFIFSTQMAIQQTLVALDQAKLSLFIACLRKLMLLIPLIYILPVFMSDKLLAVVLAAPVADTLSAITSNTLFFTKIGGILKKPSAEKELN